MPASSATVVGSIHSVYTEAAFLLLAMLRSMLNLVRTTVRPILYDNIIIKVKSERNVAV